MNILKLINTGICIGNLDNLNNLLIKKFLILKINNINILNIKKILLSIKKIKKIIFYLLKNNKKILFIGTKNIHKEIVYKYARSLKQPFVCNKWISGNLTNSINYKKNLNKLNYLKNKKLFFTKKEKSIFLKEKQNIEYLYGGLRYLKNNPEIIFITDINKEKIAINEAFRLNIKIIALSDNLNCCKKINYLIPCNINSINSVNLIFKFLFKKL
ncbi:ribosomal protein S2 [Candidatus Carsonella ruddii CS isolate Thao2000]|uniref:Small ribosomal subunit protein uS2 n=1 Tax=Candidatus Carsonella ruddii CS isolate Thao2000 TaxID=1202537 RepID=J7GYL2_CARRU|nr:30S ribosomal protein S2 [Candidatus Carsonella ruddii]AFP83683.1 ribosomal protein S2 [Candidatus Carsonella ruddii CS isolate Thao2000]